MGYDDEFDSSMQNQLAVEQLNQLLPEDIRVFSCTCFQCLFPEDTRVSKSFNPHLNTHTRTYSYYLPLDQYQSSHYAPSRIIELGVHIDTAKFQKALSVFLGTHSMKNYSGSIQYSLLSCSCDYSVVIEIRISVNSTCEPCSCYFHLCHFSNHIAATPLTIGNERYLHVLLNGNSFLYHQIRKMIGGAVAVSFGSWSFPYLNACMNLVSLHLYSSVYDASHSSASRSQHTFGVALRFLPSRQEYFSQQG